MGQEQEAALEGRAPVAPPCDPELARRARSSSVCTTCLPHVPPGPWRRAQTKILEAVPGRLGLERAPRAKPLPRCAVWPAFNEQGAPRERTRRLRRQLTASHTSRSHGQNLGRQLSQQRVGLQLNLREAPHCMRGELARRTTRPRNRLDLAALNRDRPRRNHRAALTRSRVRRCVPAALHPQWARRVTGRSGTTQHGTCRRDGALDPQWAQPLW